MGKLLTLLLILSSPLFCVAKLDPKYCIEYGDKDAPTTIIEYFSLGCPQCLALYKDEFAYIRSNYIDTGKVRWIFHPQPMDRLTIQGMECLQFLTTKQKRVFLEALMLEIGGTDTKTACAMMKRAMEIFAKPLPDLDNIELLEKSDVYTDAFALINATDKVNSIPTVEIDGVLYDDIPTKSFLDIQLQQLRGES